MPRPGRRRPAEDPLGGHVHVRDVALLVHGDDRVRSGGGDRAEVLLAQAQRLLGVLATDQRAHLGGHRGHERHQVLVLLALLEHEELDHRHDLFLRHDGHGDAAGQADRLREQSALEARVGPHVADPDRASALPCLAGQADPRDERQRLGHAPKRRQAGRRGVPGRAAHQRAAVGAQHPRLADRPAGALAHAPQHQLEGPLGRVRPGDRQRQVVGERELVLRPAPFGDVAADAVDQLQAGVRPSAELEPAK